MSNLSNEFSKQTPTKTPFSRHPFVYFFSVGVLILIALTFVIGPASLKFGFADSNEAVFGSYDDTDIVYEPGGFFAQQLQSLADQYQNAGIEIDFQTSYQIWRTAFQQTLFHTAVLKEAESIGLTASADLVDEAIRTLPQFQTDGTFDLQLYQSTSQAEVLSLRQLIRDTSIYSRMLDDIQIGTVVSEQEASFITSLGNERRSVDYILFDQTDFPQSEVLSFVGANPQTFRALELSVITLGSQEEADALLPRLKGELTFEEAAIQYSQDIFAEDGGNRGIVFAFDLQRDFEDPTAMNTVFDLPQGSVSNPLAITSGQVALYRVNSAPRPLNLESSLELDQARSYLLSYESSLVRDYLESRAQEFSVAAKAQGFETAASSFRKTISRTNEFAFNPGNLSIFPTVLSSEGTEISNAQRVKEIYEYTFNLGLGESSNPIQLSSGYMVLTPVSVGAAPDFEKEYVEGYLLPQSIAGWVSQEIERAYLSPEKVEDNFDSAFFTYVYRGDN
ncbi:MAG: hypothetical protein GW949_04620 [Spirochaetales bacterium]|nr:hypothetical protein [Spirochaetales bacterium]